MTAQNQKAEAFAALHEPGNPLILYNIWDAGSALAVARAGAKALATGSLSVAGAQGFGDGEKMPLELVIANAARIAAATDLPVSLDFETGYGDTIDELSAAVVAIIKAGIVGINIEDQVIGANELRAANQQCKRIREAAKAGLFVNARTDLFIKTPAEMHDEALVHVALDRARAYADAGARSFFVPMLVDPELLGLVCARSPLPVNVMLKPGTPTLAMLASLGVARISYGPGPWRAAMSWLEDQARSALLAS
jgi:2-methylisocitrate lyase-like PEP mutase family enzyme